MGHYNYSQPGDFQGFGSPAAVGAVAGAAAAIGATAGAIGAVPASLGLPPLDRGAVLVGQLDTDRDNFYVAVVFTQGAQKDAYKIPSPMINDFMKDVVTHKSQPKTISVQRNLILLPFNATATAAAPATPDFGKARSAAYSIGLYLLLTTMK